MALEFDNNIKLELTKLTTISIENKHYYYDFITNLGSECRNENYERNVLSLLYDGQKIQLDKTVNFISDFSRIELNSKWINGAILKKLTSFLTHPEESEARGDFERCINRIISDFKIYTDLNIDSEIEIEASDIAKICSPIVIDDKSSLLERLIDYIDLYIELKNTKIIILVSVKLFLNEEEIEFLHKYCLDQELFLILLESCDCSEVMSFEKRIIIDNQMCIIYQNF